MQKRRPTPYYVALMGITLVLLIAAFMRVYHITQQSLWFDEAFAWNIVQQPDMFPRIAADTHPPLYYLLLRGWIGVTGDSALALRYLSALTSIITVALVYQIGREFIRQRDRGLYIAVPVVAALLMALTDMEIDLAQEARNYALYTCLGCLSMWLYLRWIRREVSSDTIYRVSARLPLSISERGLGGEVLIAAWIFANAALVYTHYQGAFIPAIQGLHTLLFLRGRKRLNAIGALAVSGLLLAPWLVLVTLPQAKRAIANDIPFSIPSNWDSLLHLRQEFFGSMWALMLVLTVIGMVEIRRKDAKDAKIRKENSFSWRSWRFGGSNFLIIFWLIVPFVVLFLGNLYAPLLTERKLAIITPAIALLVAFGLANLRRPAAQLVLAAIVIYSVSYVDSYRLKEPWNQVAADAARYAESGDLALIEMGNGQYPMKYYWEHEMPDGVTLSTFPVLGDPTMAPTTDWYTYYDGLLPQLIQQTESQHAGDVTTVWLAFWSKENASIDRLTQAGFVRTMTTTHDHLGNALDLYRYDLLPRTPSAAYDSGMILRAVEIDSDALRVDLWWSADAPLTMDYVTSALLLDANGALVGQLDSIPFLTQRSTLGWQAGEVIYDPKQLVLANGMIALPPGTYTVVVQVYSFTDAGQIQKSLTVDGADWYVAGTVTR